jgi:ribosomal protein L24E
MLLFSSSGSIEDGMGKTRVRKDGTRFLVVLLEVMAEVCNVDDLKIEKNGRRLTESLLRTLKALG